MRSLRRSSARAVLHVLIALLSVITLSIAGSRWFDIVNQQEALHDLVRQAASGPATEAESQILQFERALLNLQTDREGDSSETSAQLAALALGNLRNQSAMLQSPSGSFADFALLNPKATLAIAGFSKFVAQARSTLDGAGPPANLQALITQARQQARHMNSLAYEANAYHSTRVFDLQMHLRSLYRQMAWLGVLLVSGIAIGLLVNFRTSRKMARADAALRATAGQFHSIAEAHPIPVILGRVKDQKIVYANRASVPLMGACTEAICSQKAGEFFAATESYNQFYDLMTANQAVNNFPTELRTSDGRQFKAELTARPTNFNGEAVVAVSVVDTTERNAALEEIARQRDALIQSEKLSALGSMLASVSHELNNPLSIVVGQSQLLEASATDSQTISRAAKINAAAKRSAQIIKSFRAMARVDPPDRAAVDLNAVVRRALQISGFGHKTSGITLVLDLADDLPLIEADDARMVQVVVNLVNNARQELEKHDAERLLTISSEKTDDEQLQLRVSDNAPRDCLRLDESMFDMGFNTSSETLGTDIGLSVSASIVRSHGGNINARKLEGGGLTLQVNLPIVSQSLNRGRDTPPASPPAERQQQRILIVDDEPEVATTIREILEMEGYQTECVHDAQHALKSLTARKFDLVISDLRMPNMDGPALYREIQRMKLHPPDQVAFITGDGLNNSVQGFVQGSGLPVIEKPFQPEELKRVVRSVVSNASVS